MRNWELVNVVCYGSSILVMVLGENQVLGKVGFLVCFGKFLNLVVSKSCACYCEPRWGLYSPTNPKERCVL